MISFGAEQAAALVSWYERNAREYPWKDVKDPWAIWVSEVMLQQTTVATVGPRYRIWMDKYPDTASLARTPEEAYLRDWEGLGYYNRVRNLASAAVMVQEIYAGKIPGSSLELKTLPGVGDYIAAAVSSFAFGEKTAAIEANGRRIAMRLSALNVCTKALENELKTRLEAAMEDFKPALINGALMQFGQLVCTPGTPSCGDCPLSPVCKAYAGGLQDSIPPGRRKKISRIESAVSICLQEDRVFMVRRSRGIGRGLWVFPRDEEITWAEGSRDLLGELDGQVHTYTRYREQLLPRIYSSCAGLHVEEEGEWIALADLQSRAMPTAYRRIVKDLMHFTAHSLVRRQG